VVNGIMLAMIKDGQAMYTESGGFKIVLMLPHEIKQMDNTVCFYVTGMIVISQLGLFVIVLTTRLCCFFFLRTLLIYFSPWMCGSIRACQSGNVFTVR